MPPATVGWYLDAVADMLKIARHRGWSQVRVAGDETFRREVWIQAQALGLEVAGHRPRDRDRQAAGLGPSSAGPQRRALGARLSRAAVVVHRLIADPAARARLLDRALKRASNLPERDRRSEHERSR